MASLIGILACLTVFTIMLLLYNLISPVSDTSNMRLKETAVSGEFAEKPVNDILEKPLMHRTVLPFIQEIAGSVWNVTPNQIRKTIEKKLVVAGGLGGLSASDMMAISWMVVLFFSIIIISVAVLKGAKMVTVAELILATVLLGLYFPMLILNMKITSRQKKIQKDLPNVLDILTISVEAGLGFDGALVKLSEKMKGDLVTEMERMLQEMRMGITRREALAAMAERCQVDELSLLTATLIQADHLGVSISQVLRVQSDAIREKRRQQIEEKAMKAPVKMLIPLITCIFPVLFIILLGPAVIKIMSRLFH